jgi:predicted nucleic acid-binding protein
VEPPRALAAHRLLGIDTSLFIYAFERHPTFGALSRDLLRAIADGRLVAVASTLVLAEVLVAPFKAGRAELVDGYTARLTAMPNLRLLEPGVAICRTAARLRAERPSLRLPDALHLATAIEGGATGFVTNDRDLRSAPELAIVRLSDLTG